MRTLFLMLFAASMFCMSGCFNEVEGEGGIERPPLDQSTLPKLDPTQRQAIAPPG